MSKKFYVTTAIAYTSGKPHIGNTYEIVLTDAIARFKKMQGYDVYFQTGTDEHGAKIEDKAKAAGTTPKQFVDGVAGSIKAMWDLMNVEYDHFIRTTDGYHEAEVQRIFKKFYEQGDIYKGEYEGKYCTPCESFWTESQLVDGKCPDCGREVKPAKEEAYFFKMSKYADRLMKYIDEHPDFIKPVSRKNEMVNNFLKPGLQDLCVSRTSFKWGIPVDFDDKHVVYVWLDALTNYITGIGYHTDGSDDKYKQLWPADLHVIGKDIVRFHTIYWPIFLMALNEPLPKQVYGHGWLLQDGGKMSKSKGNVIYADDLVNFFGVDAVRYYVLSQMPYDNDGLISWELVIDTLNTDLANTFGNLVSRTVAMVNKYFGGKVCDKKASAPVDDNLKEVVASAAKKASAKMDDLCIADAISEVFGIFRRANKYIDETMPWVLAKNEADFDRLSTVLYNLVESIAIGATLLLPFTPTLASKALEQIGVAARPYETLDKFGLTAANTVVTASPDNIFKRIDGPAVLESVNAMYAARAPKAAATPIKVVEKEEISIDDFAKINLQVGKVLAAEKVEKADKLLKMTVKTGVRERTIVSGIAKYYTPEQMVGKSVVVVANLKPAKLRGILSEGMILCAEDAEGKLAIVSPESVMPDGSEVR